MSAARAPLSPGSCQISFDMEGGRGASMDCLPSGPVCSRVWVTAVSRPGHNGVLSLQDDLFAHLDPLCNPCCSVLGVPPCGAYRVGRLSF